jgi:hypothetical protein
MAERTPAEIRLSIEENRQELIRAVENSRSEIVRITDWRQHIADHKEELTKAAAVAGFIVGGAIVLSSMRRRKRLKR